MQGEHQALPQTARRRMIRLPRPRELLVDEVCVAFKAHLGWVNAVAVACGARAVDCRDARRLTLVAGTDRETAEPYHVAGGWDGLEQRPRPADPLGIIRRGRQRQVRAARRVLGGYADTLEGAGLRWTRAVVLTGRGWLGHDLEDILSSHAHIHVYEGEAIRDATRQALKALGKAFVEQDEKSTLAAAADLLGAADPDALLKERRPPAVSTWRKEERLLALAAWLHRRPGAPGGVDERRRARGRQSS